MSTSSLGTDGGRSWAALCGVVLLASASLSLASETASISGSVIDSKTKAPVAQASVILVCTCLPTGRAAQTDNDGVYRFSDLAAGTYTVQVLDQNADAEKIVVLPSSVKMRVDFRINPNGD